MSASETKPYKSIDASPVKSFFVRMLTRDIQLEDAILDLLDNCVDGILRVSHKKGLKPYAGYYAEINFDDSSFSISDNCGGIPWSMHEYALRMGPAPKEVHTKPGTIGVYGIGMKRAIFKMGKQCLISTQSGDDNYDIDITPEWIGNEDNWNLPVKASKKQKNIDGTTIVIGDLYPGISKQFADTKSFKKTLDDLIATQYAFIIDKGFQVKVNTEIVIPSFTRLVFKEVSKEKVGTGIQPYIYKTEAGGVKVFLTVGFTRTPPSDDEIVNEQNKKSLSSDLAGWSIICNDRAVVYNDKSILTGWGDAGIPKYHTQFIAISGIVEFKADDASKLPTTTTKRGIDGGSELYLQIKSKMREGMRMFTNYTNKWKGREDESKKLIEAGQLLSFEEIKEKAKQITLTHTLKTIPPGEQFVPDLPMPKKLDPLRRRISYSKETEKIRTLADHLFGDSNIEPSEVGEKCFDLIYEEARR